MSEAQKVPTHLLGFKDKPEWLDMSDYVIHFTKTEAAFRSILRSGYIRPGGPFGWALRQEPVRAGQMSACFSEVPLDRTDRIVARHGTFGLAFKKDFIKSSGGARVWYLDDGSVPSRALFERIGQVMRAGAWDDELWKITPFIDRVMPGVYEWEWEREWRVPDGLRFSLSDIAFTMTPEGLEEGLEVGAPMFHPEYETVWVDATPALLGDEIEDMVATFLQKFENPVNSLPVDGGEYVWIVDQWETDDAVRHLFEDVEESVFEALCDGLNEISNEWVRLSDWDEFYEDANND